MNSPHQDAAAQIGRALRSLLAEAAPTQQTLAARLDVGPTDVQALQHLADASTPTGTVELGNLLRIRSASATVLVDRLETAGHVRREPHPTDGRRVTLRVTDTASDRVREALSPLLHSISGLVSGYTHEEKACIAEFLEGSVRLLREYNTKN